MTLNLCAKIIAISLGDYFISYLDESLTLQVCFQA